MRPIDVLHLGREHVICCWEVDGVLVDPGPESCIDTLLAALGGEAPKALLLTHIHFDHAGASGALVERWPDLPVYVHERGARHLEDPERLVSSARRLYGDDFDRLWGRVVPVPERNLHPLSGGETVLDGYRVAYAPGHASHHVAYFHEGLGTAFTGDVAGVKIGDGPVMAPTPPPDVDVEAWDASIEQLRAWAPEQLAVTHFGLHGDVPAHLDALQEDLHAAAELARDSDEATFAEGMRRRLEEQTGDPGGYAQAMPPDNQYGGLRRYWDKRAERG